MAYTVEFAQSVRDQLRVLTAQQRTTVLDAIETQLCHQPLVETKQRKPPSSQSDCTAGVTVGNLRAFYEVDADQPDTVRILAVGRKKGSKLYISDAEVEL